MPGRTTPQLRDNERALRHEMGALIREARLTAGLSLVNLARTIGYRSYRPLWLIEMGRMPIAPDKLPLLEAALQLKPHTLFWKEARCRLLRLGFEVPMTLTEEAPRPEMVPAGSSDPAA